MIENGRYFLVEKQTRKSSAKYNELKFDHSKGHWWMRAIALASVKIEDPLKEPFLEIFTTCLPILFIYFL